MRDRTSPRRSVANLSNPIAQIIVLLRFFCVLAIFYLALQKTIARFSRKPNSKLLWFFAVLTEPLTFPVKKWSPPDATDDQIASCALIFYGLVWLVLSFAGRFS
jgi:hypothetical protein